MYIHTDNYFISMYDVTNTMLFYHHELLIMLYNVIQRIGGNSKLSADGEKYAENLKAFMDKYGSVVFFMTLYYTLVLLSLHF